MKTPFLSPRPLLLIAEQTSDGAKIINIIKTTKKNPKNLRE